MTTIETKLPKVGTTIFTQMSALAVEYDAINLSQGFPDFDGADYLKQRVCHHIQTGANQYAPMSGVPVLTQAIAQKSFNLYQKQIDPVNEITVTSGATEAIFAAVHAVVKAGDEVIVFDPAYDCYEPAIDLAGGYCIHIPLTDPDFSLDWDLLSQAINDKTRLIIINSPHNPTGSIITRDDLERLWQLIKNRDILLISDEVYEHILFDQQPHASVLTHQSLYERSFVISSFGKTYHVTGWKVGYCVAPKALTSEFRKVHQYITFSTSTPMQFGIADMLHAHPEHAQQLPDFYQQKRDVFASYIEKTHFKLLPCAGTYFQLVDYSGISELSDFDFCVWLIKEAGVAAIPVSVFYQNPPPNQKIIRFCFAKGEDTLAEAGRRLASL